MGGMAALLQHEVLDALRSRRRHRSPQRQHALQGRHHLRRALRHRSARNRGREPSPAFLGHLGQIQHRHRYPEPVRPRGRRLGSRRARGHGRAELAADG
eukprot:10055-Rhodomonas_salina.1